MDHANDVVRTLSRPATCAIQKASYKMRPEHHAVVEGESGWVPRTGTVLGDADSFLVRYNSRQGYSTGLPILNADHR
jgi:hypothetical protein